MFTVNSTLISAVLTGPTDWVCYIGTLTLCIEAVAWSCIIVTWWSGSGGIQAWSRRPTGFLQYFDTVAFVILPVKVVPEMTYNVLSGTLFYVKPLLYSRAILRQRMFTIFANIAPTLPIRLRSTLDAVDTWCRQQTLCTRTGEWQPVNAALMIACVSH